MKTNDIIILLVVAGAAVALYVVYQKFKVAPKPSSPTDTANTTLQPQVPQNVPTAPRTGGGTHGAIPL